MMRDLYNALPLPDDRPITSICVVEELSGCPSNYTLISKSHDQDIDADLYKDGFFRRVTRYLCHSKVEGYMGYVVEQLAIVHERESPPSGYTIVEQTLDTSQKAFKKRQLCYKQVPQKMASQTITDIIILSRSKVAPEGFSLVGELNGMCVCIKPGPAPGPGPTQSNVSSQSTQLPYGMEPRGGGISGSGGGGGQVYPMLTPGRPAPATPLGTSQYPQGQPPPLPPRLQPRPGPSPSHTTEASVYGPTQSALFGVPFVLNKRYVNNGENGSLHIPTFSKKSRQQIEDEYYYNFNLEQDIVQRPTASTPTTSSTPATSSVVAN